MSDRCAILYVGACLRARSRLRDEVACLLRFGIVGLANTLLGLAAITILQWGCGLNPFLANGGGFAIGMAAGFVLNRSFTFRAEYSRTAMLRYAAAVALAFGGNLLVLATVRAHLPGFAGAAIAAQVAAMSAYTAVNYLLCRYWVFGMRRGSAMPEVASIV